MLFFIQFWRIPPRAGCAVCFTRRCLDGIFLRRAYFRPVVAKTKLFCLQVELAGMLAPKVQATTIELRLRRGRMGVNGRQHHAVSGFTSLRNILSSFPAKTTDLQSGHKKSQPLSKKITRGNLKRILHPPPMRPPLACAPSPSDPEFLLPGWSTVVPFWTVPRPETS